MRVSELIDALKELPKDAEYRHIYDGGARGGIEAVWLTQGGQVVSASPDEVVYSDKNRPVGAPLTKENRYWKFNPEG